MAKTYHSQMRNTEAEYRMCLLLTRYSHYITTCRYLQQNVQRRINFTSLYSRTTSYIVLLHSHY